MKRLLWSALLLMVAGSEHPTLSAQSPDAQMFEVASVKPNRSLNGFTVFRVQPGGRFTVTNASLLDIITVAYQMRGFEISGGPGWMGSERFDIMAKAGGELPPLPPATAADAYSAPVYVMLRSLLAERFKLATRFENRDAPAYALVVSRSDRKLGPQLTPSTLDCATVLAARRAASRGAASAGAPPPPPPLLKMGEPPVPCTMGGGPGGMVVGGTMPIAALTRTLARIVNRNVIDQTNLTGNFDFVLAFTPEQMPPLPTGLAPSDLPAPPVADLPSIFTALQEQLGLKLESTRGATRFLVIDQVDRPTEN